MNNTNATRYNMIIYLILATQSFLQSTVVQHSWVISIYVGSVNMRLIQSGPVDPLIYQAISIFQGQIYKFIIYK